MTCRLPGSKLTGPQMAQRIKELRAEGLKSCQIAQRLGVSAKTVPNFELRYRRKR